MYSDNKKRDNVLCNVTGSVVFVDFCPWAKPLIKCVVRQTRGSQDPHHGYLIKFACVCVCFFLDHKSKFDQSRVKYKLVLMSISLVQEDMIGLLLSGIPFLVYGILRKEKNLTVYLFAVPQN